MKFTSLFTAGAVGLVLAACGEAADRQEAAQGPPPAAPPPAAAVAPVQPLKITASA
jgi:hypothetical protein